MKRDNLNAFLLHRRPYRETSYLAEFFTQEEGKVHAVCKGVRGSKSDRKSLLQPFQPILVTVYGRNELKNAGSVESVSKPFPLVGRAMFSGMYLNELLSRCLPIEVAFPNVFDAYTDALQALTENAPLEPLLRNFELLLLDELGYTPDWDYDCETGESILPDSYYQYINEQGFTCAPVNGLRAQIPGNIIIDIAQRHWHPMSLKWSKHIMRQAFLPILGTKPLKSRELFLHMEQQR
ncbi:DNA repair protein RecO [Aestuariibacter sp. AA17]|uniref:DNA repair protein RecO n=1 Tax=Fluctibacter corallii TaxID=2984329 RepID=A0ABT3A4T3_9ALTE|nr:DNA repair protein RecO [Aestuariibacter sp. AA17]MCV2883554.1 DNA repair protein RecO [Aestuariibacter sp. AA17]